MIKFSIIVPCYKDLFLRECISSILSQTYTNFELILVNDGPPYNLDEIVGEFQDKRIRYYRRKHGLGAKKLVDNWNDCLKYVTGEYVINMGDDDKLLPNCLQAYIDLMAGYPKLDIYHMRTEFIDENSNVIGEQSEYPSYESIYSFVWSILSLQTRPVIGDFLYKGDTLRKNNGYYNLPYAWHSDRISAIIMAKEKGIASTQIIGFQFRNSRYEISSDTAITEDKVQCWTKIKKWYQDFLSLAPMDSESVYYYNLSRKELNRFIENSILEDIDSDLAANKWRVFKWVSRVFKLRLSVRVLWITIYNAIIKFRNKESVIDI